MSHQLVIRFLSLSAISASFLHCPCDLLIEYFELRSLTVFMMGVIVSLVFLILPWFPQYFLCVKWNTFFTRISLPLYHSFIQEWIVPAFFKNFLLPPFCSLTKNPKILFPPPVKEKNTMKQIAYETTKVNIPNLLRDWKTRTGFIRYKQLT